jgi:hypothetical protein
MESCVKLDETMEMAYPGKYLEHIIIGLEDPLSQHLVELVGFDFPAEQRRHFRREVRTRLDKIQRLRLKPNNRSGSFKFYYDLLYDYPFGGVEVQNRGVMLPFIAEEYDNPSPLKTAEELVAWLRDFHTRLAQRLTAGENVLDLVPDRSDGAPQVPRAEPAADQ